MATASCCSSSVFKTTTIFRRTDSELEAFPRQTLVRLQTSNTNYVQSIKLSKESNFFGICNSSNKKLQKVLEYNETNSCSVVMFERGRVVLQVFQNALKKAIPAVVVSLGLLLLYDTHSSALAAAAPAIGGWPTVYAFMWKAAAFVSLLRFLWYSWDARTPTAKNFVIRILMVCSSPLMRMLSGLIRLLLHFIAEVVYTFRSFANLVKTRGWRYVLSVRPKEDIEERC